MKKLAIVTTHPIQYYAPVFKALAALNADIKVFYTWGEDSVKKYDPDFKKVVEWDIPLLEGYPYEFLQNSSPNPGTSQFKGIINPNAIQAIDSYNPDVILVYGWAWHSHLKIIRHYSKKKIIWFRGDSTLLDVPGGIKKIIRGLFLRWVYKHVDTALYVGERNKEYFQRFGLTPEQLIYAPHSVDNSRFSADHASAAATIRNRLGIPPSGIVILFAGKLEPKKDPFTLLAAFEAIEDQNAFLIFAGNGILEGELKALAQKSRKQRSIFFLDFQNQSSMPALYQACDIFCLPSAGPGETWGLAVNEAMAAGKAVVVSDKVGCAENLVKEGVNGSIFPHRNKSELASKLQDLTRNPQRLRDFGAASQNIIENWSFDRQVSIILGALNNIQCPK